MLRYASAAVLAVSLVSGVSHAAPPVQPGEGSKALFLSNVFNESNVAFQALGLPAGPTYNLGLFLSNDLMAYGSVRLINHEEGTNAALGGGVRLYQSRPGALRTFLDGSLSYIKLDGVDDNAGGTIDGDIVSLGGYFGAEYLFTKNASVAAKVGGAFSDFGGDLDFTTLDLGVAEVMFNFYF
ncbi:MAG: hypothetical protein P1U78_03090 [Alcanivoracaceae bacterium]|nr:hypothetical protein [Alcanivoracaceae bacterium]